MVSFQNAANLSGRVALVTGGGSGIGRGCAELLAESGAAVLITGRRVEKLEETAQTIRQAGGICELFAADLALEENCQAAAAACIEKFGRLDILVNNAGSKGVSGSLEDELSSENFENTMRIDFNTVFWMVKYSYQECAMHGVGSIINIASLAALNARGPIMYSAAKGAVRSMSRTLAKRLGPLGIRVNTIYPGFIVTEMTEGILSMPELEAKYKAESPLGLLGNPEDIGYCTVYLASDAAKFVTGQDFVIDGGAVC